MAITSRPQFQKYLIVFIVCCQLIFAMKSSADEKSVVYVQLGHRHQLFSVAFSPDGKKIASGSGDHTVKLWDVTSGREINTLTGHTSGVRKVSFSPDGGKIFSACSEEMKLWDTETFKEIKTFRYTENNGHADLSHDGKVIVSASEHSLKTLDVKTGHEINGIKTNGRIDFIKISPNGNMIAGIVTVHPTRYLYLWDAKTGKQIHSLKRIEGLIYSLEFSPDNNLIASAAEDGLDIWDTKSRRNIKSLKDRQSFCLAFSPDGQSLAYLHDRAEINLLNLKTGKDLRTFKWSPSSSCDDGPCLFMSLAFSQDGKTLAAGDNDNTIKLWNVGTGNQIKSLQGHSAGIDYVSFASSSRTVAFASGGGENKIKFWDIESATAGKTINGASRPVFSPDGRFLVFNGNGGIKVLDVKTNKEVKTLDGRHYGDIKFSPSGKLLAYGNAGFLSIYDAENWRKIHTLKASVSALSFSPNSKWLASANLEGVVHIWDLQSGRFIKKMQDSPPFENTIFCIQFSSDGNSLASAGGGNIIKIWDIKTGKKIKTLEGHKKDSGIKSLAFSPHAKILASASSDFTIKLWDTDTGKELRTCKGHLGEVNSIVFSDNGKMLISGSNDSTSRLWNVHTGEEIAQMVIFDNNEWIAITPEGYYNSSLNGHQYLNIRMGNKVYGIDQFYDVFYRPDIVMAKLKSEDIKPLITLTIDDAIKNPPPEVDFTSVPSDSTTPKVKVCYQAKNTGGGIGEVRLFHNGKLIQSDGFYKDVAKTGGKIRLASLDSKSIREDMRGIVVRSKIDISSIASKAKRDIVKDCVFVDAVPGENEVSVSAFNKDNTVQSYMKTTGFKANIKAEDSHLYVLIVGIDQYNDQSVNLKYAVKDARGIKDKLLGQSATLYKPENIHAVVLTDKEATKANIQSQISMLAKKIKPADSFVLFVAGHGVLLQNQYFMLTHDFDGNLNDKSMISSNEIVETSKQIKSLSQLFIFDTCHAGGVDYIVCGLYDARMSVLAKKMGLHIYASANDKQAAMDGYKGNGLFTHTLLEGLKNKKEADKNNDGAVSLVELGGYSKQATTNISKEIGHSQTPLIINFGKDQSVYKLQNVR